MRDNVTKWEMDQRIGPSAPTTGLDFGYRLSVDPVGAVATPYCCGHTVLLW